MFHVETLTTEQTAKLNLYADSFVQFIETAFLSERTVKVVRIGLRLLRFVLLYCENLSSKTNLKRLCTDLIEMLNDQKGILRNEVQHLFIYLSYVSITPSIRHF